MAPVQQEVVAQEGALVGDDNVAAPVSATPIVSDSPAAAQVSPPRGPEPTTVPVHETVVVTDRVITDPSSPEAVQVPDAGRGFLDLPVHALAKGTVEEQLAAAQGVDSEPVAEPVVEPEVVVDPEVDVDDSDPDYS